MEKAGELMQNQKDCISHNIPVMPIFIISCNNLAETHCLLKNWKGADKMLKRSIYYILYVHEEQLHSQVEHMLSKWFFNQMLLYREFSKQSGEP